ncbi:unnamed protein product [Toxocara canis]|uniref:C2H2-type domain-containing protein n=1 Tax=Toxocara canis TaxID=6265 RepID=A0A183VEA9_TOXCA|nr:unnamed protein product [Toxocara canis]
MDCFGDGGFMPGGSQSNDAFYDGYQPHALSNEDWLSSIEESVSVTVRPTAAETPEAKGPDDPYLCSLCDFVTLYKGNMKRHLSTCHSLAQEEFQDGGLDSLRASRCVENSELLQNREAYEGGKRSKVDEGERNSVDIGDPLTLSSLENRDMLVTGRSERKDLIRGVTDHLSCSRSADVATNGIAGVESMKHEESVSELESKPADLTQQTSSLGDETSIEKRYRMVVQGNVDERNIAEPDDGAAKTHADVSSASNIDEIINAVASNQLGSPAKKLDKGGTTGRSSSRRSRIPKTVRNMDEVRDYWEAERLNSGGTLPISSSFTGRSRSTNFVALMVTQLIPDRQTATDSRTSAQAELRHNTVLQM